VWKQIEKPRTVLASRALVNEFVNMEPAPYDRPLSEKRLQVYERILSSNEFRTVTWASCVCLETGNTYRVNGKHTATLLSKRDPLPEFHITVERYQADTLHDVANLYNTFDSNLASRTVSDINAAFAATIPELRNVAHRTVNLIVSAASFLKWSESEIKRVPPAERAEELLEWTDFAQWLTDIMPLGGGGSIGIARQLFRSSVFAAMMSTYRKAPRLALEFWLQVRDETNADRDNATRVLARFLIHSAMASGKTISGRDKKIVTPREMYAKCIHAYNAWRRDEVTRLNYYPDADLPVPIK